MAITKPDLTRIWAEGAIPSNVIDPDVTTPGSFSDGWEAEIPSFQHFNSLQQGFTTATAYNNEQGINEWDAITTYPVNAYAKGSDGVLYIALVESTDQNPLSNPALWRVVVDANDLRSNYVCYLGFRAKNRNHLVLFDISHASAYDIRHGWSDVC